MRFVQALQLVKSLCVEQTIFIFHLNDSLQHNDRPHKIFQDIAKIPKSQVDTISNDFHFSSEHISTEHFPPESILKFNYFCSYVNISQCHILIADHFHFHPTHLRPFWHPPHHSHLSKCLLNLIKFELIDNDQNVSFIQMFESYKTRIISVKIIRVGFIIGTTTIWLSWNHPLPNHYLSSYPQVAYRYQLLHSSTHIYHPPPSVSSAEEVKKKIHHVNMSI